MENGCSSKFTSWIDTLMIQDLSPGKMNRLRDHLSDCPHCQQRYNRAVMASRLLDGGPQAIDSPSAREISWVGHQVLERTRLVPDNAPVRRSVVSWVAGLAATAAALAIVLPLALQTAPPTTGGHPPQTKLGGPQPGAGPLGVTEFQVRGIPSATKTDGLKLGFRAFCIKSKEGGPPDITGLVPAAAQAPPATCGLRDILRFAYTNRSELGYLFLVGLDEQYALKWYEPHPPDRQSIEVKPDVVDRPLPRAVRLNINHKQGLVRIFAIFSKTPLAANQVERSVRQIKRARQPLELVKDLPIEDTQQHSLLVRLSP